MLPSAGEWFNSDTEAIINQALQTGSGPNVSDAYTINGLTGPTYNCSAKGINYNNNVTNFISYLSFDILNNVTSELIILLIMILMCHNAKFDM